MDLSPVTPLVLMFLRQAHFGKSGFGFRFVHVLSGSEAGARSRWEVIKRLVGYEEDFPLQIVPRQGDIAGVLLHMVESGGYGTVVMGKRGLTGIKRWLLGSVSKGMLHGLKDQSLFLID